MLAERYVLNNRAKVIFLDRLSQLKPMRQLHMEGVLGWIQKYFPVGFIIGEYRVVISNKKGT